MRFSPYLPDRAASEGASIAKNVIPVVDGYQPMPSPAVYSAALNSKYLGGGVFKTQASTVYNYAGTATKLYRLSGASWTDMSRTSGGVYAATRWEFAQWLNTVIAVNRVDVPQSVTMGGANFAALAGSPPKAATIAVMSDDFVMLGNLIESGTTKHNAVHWCAYRDPTNWTPDTETQCDRRDLESTDGPIHRLIGGEVGLVFQEKAISRVTLAGLPWIFQFDKMTTNLGSISAGGIVPHGHDVFFISQDGFAMVKSRSEYVRIGTDSVDKTFFKEVRSNHLDKIVSGYWDDLGVVVWAYPGPASSDGVPNRQLIFNPALGQWSESDYTLQGFQVAAESALASDSMTGYSDTYLEMMDSAIYAGGTPSFGVFDGSNRLAFMTGAPGTVYVETNEVRRNPGQKTYLKKGIPDIQNGTPTISVGTRNRQIDATVWAPYRSLNSYGEWDLHMLSEYQKFRVRIEGATGLARGVDFIEVPGHAR